MHQNELRERKARNHFSLLSGNGIPRFLRPNIIPKGILHVNKPEMPPGSDIVNGLKIPITKLNLPEIRLNPLRIRTLRQHDIPPPQPPGNQHLRQRTPLLLRNVIESRVLADLLAGRGDLILRA